MEKRQAHQAHRNKRTEKRISGFNSQYKRIKCTENGHETHRNKRTEKEINGLGTKLTELSGPRREIS